MTILPHHTPMHQKYQRIMVESSQTQQDYLRGSCIHQLFEKRAAQTPEAVALIYEGEQLTYHQLNARANQLAHSLRRFALPPEALIGVCLERHPDMIVSLLAVLKAGGAFVPLDPAYPRERLAFMLHDSQMPILLSQQHLLERLPDHRPQTICLDTAWLTITQEADINPLCNISPSHLAYAIYTSGSTGTPKGVLVPHEALAHLCLSVQEVYQLTASDRVLQFSTLCFDASPEEIFPTLITGATLVLRGRNIWSPLEFYEQLSTLQVTVTNLPTAYWQQLVYTLSSLSPTTVPEVAHQLRIVTVGSERMLPHYVQRWWQTPLRTARLLNAYGPTETTVTATIFAVPEQAETPDSIPIGRPLPLRSIYMLDPQGYLVPQGAVGELHIGGRLLARGYLNRPDLTAEKFVPDPFSDLADARPYKTGDLARYLPDGNIEFLGRLDHQIKLRGFRIEMGEIEAVLNQHEAIRESLVVLREDETRGQHLVVYFICPADHQPTDEELRIHLQRQLPAYMVPSAFMQLEHWPVTPNGKIDRSVLPEPGWSSADQPDTYVAPRAHLEQTVAKVWWEVLGLQQIGIHESFFALGGHSLLVMQLLARFQSTVGFTLPLHTFFAAPTIAEMAHAIEVAIQPPDTIAASRIVPLVRTKRMVQRSSLQRP
jgi:amino acid adenylation domain-containing protein